MSCHRTPSALLRCGRDHEDVEKGRRGGGRGGGWGGGGGGGRCCQEGLMSRMKVRAMLQKLLLVFNVQVHLLPCQPAASQRHLSPHPVQRGHRLERTAGPGRRHGRQERLLLLTICSEVCKGERDGTCSAWRSCHDVKRRREELDYLGEVGRSHHDSLQRVLLGLSRCGKTLSSTPGEMRAVPREQMSELRST